MSLYQILLAVNGVIDNSDDDDSKSVNRTFQLPSKDTDKTLTSQILRKRLQYIHLNCDKHLEALRWKFVARELDGYDSMAWDEKVDTLKLDEAKSYQDLELVTGMFFRPLIGYNIFIHALSVDSGGEDNSMSGSIAY